MNNEITDFFATCPLFIESLLADELKSLGALAIKQTIAGVYFNTNLENAYKICLWSRFANHILMPLKKFEASNPDELYNEIGQIQWKDHLEISNTFMINSTIVGRVFNNSQYVSQKTKDAIVDYFNNIFNTRPSVNKDDPDIKINVHIKNKEVTVSLDLSGDSLHMRGYQKKKGEATIKENVAAAMLVKAGWKEISAGGGSLVDLMCGSATLLIEGALIAGDIAPGLFRKRFGFERWLRHDEKIWKKLKEEALDIKFKNFKNIPRIIGFDNDERSLNAARENIKQAGLENYITLFKKDINNFDFELNDLNKGLVAVNPPYGVRLGEKNQLKLLYQKLGQILLNNFNGWNASVITGDEELSRSISLRPSKVHSLYNGSIKCTLCHYIISPDIEYGYESKIYKESDEGKKTEEKIKSNVEIFSNRIKRWHTHLKKWLKRENVTCYRLYDADIPNYAVAIDVYENKWVNLQEYAPPKEIDPVKAEKRLKDVISVLPGLLNIKPENVFIKTRRRQKKLNQYTKLNNMQNYEIIHENGLKFYVNFEDYLDTGIFLDHRIIRKMIMELSQGKHFLNLFAYTGTATVYAAKGGALTTVSVDKSKTYTEWAKNNLDLNNMYNEKKHKFYSQDCMEWLKKDKNFYDLIFIDPPTFSNTKDRDEFVVQRDHGKLIRLAADHLSVGGLIIFSNNFRKFKLDPDLLEKYKVEDISKKTIPYDFERNQKIHHAWLIKKI
jgi:23S rRNA (guanine2445-N2)-methyltransferase / 23S rRNA (guanine2069-N7)-methyltransferase